MRRSLHSTALLLPLLSLFSIHVYMYYIPRGSGTLNATRLRVLLQSHIDTTTASLQIFCSLWFTGPLLAFLGVLTLYGCYEGKEKMNLKSNDAKRWC